MKQYIYVFIFCILFLTNKAYAQVEISEIAWMGTIQSANDEWIELFNTSKETISLDGWTLSAADETPTITLSGSVAGGGYFLLERTNDETVPQIPADLIYVGALGNSGETLTLKNADGNDIAQVPAQEGWPAGDNVTKETMQWVSGAWITAPATPKAQGQSKIVEQAPLPEEPVIVLEEIVVPPPPPVVIQQTPPQEIIPPPVAHEAPPVQIQSLENNLPTTTASTTVQPIPKIAPTPIIQSVIQKPQKSIAPKKTSTKKDRDILNASSLALAGGTYKIEKPESLWQKIWNFPQTIVTFIKKLFNR